ncbi:MAG: permease [Spirochaetaceae bacterium]|nr:MAG: permease [Spirochaetaceae bacterium]
MLKHYRKQLKRKAERAWGFFVIQTLVVLTTLKWVMLATVAGVIAGVPTGIFLLLLDAGTGVVYAWRYYFFLIPLGLVLSSWIVERFARDARGHGTEKVIEALHNQAGYMNPLIIPVKMVATLVTLILGGSAGKEGPSAQIGAGVASAFASLVRLNRLDKQRFVLCGISAGFAGVFGTPIAGALFATEVLSIGRLSYNRFLPALMASYIAYFVTRLMGVVHLSYSVEFIVSSELSMLWKMVIFGLVIGTLAILFISMLFAVEHLFRKIRIYEPLKGLIGGAILIAVVILTGTTNYVGIGTRIIDAALDGQAFRGIAPFFKMITTSVTLASGGSGGILTPIFFIGATAGNYWAQITGTNVALFSAIGMVAFLAACTNTPLAAVMMAMELFGIRTGSYGAVACAVAFLIVGHMSVYPSQVIHQQKTLFIDLEMHGISKVFTPAGTRRLFASFFSGYRTDRDDVFEVSGDAVGGERAEQTSADTDQKDVE